MSSSFSHLDESGTARMVHVDAKAVVRRTARASGLIHMAPKTLAALRDNALPKGDVLTVARIAAIQAAKRTHELIPLCHQLPLDGVAVDFAWEETGIRITAEAVATARTGVEMEALTAVSIAALTIYDMCKSADKSMRISDIVVEEKKKESPLV